MATGVEKMVAAMLGISPEEMKNTIGQALGLLSTLEKRLNAIEQKTDAIYQHLYGASNQTVIELKPMETIDG